MRIAIWHFTYCRWYDNDRAGHRLRATIWGAVADKVCLTFWPVRN